MKPFYVTGHMNPDCDAIVSAIAYAHLKQQLGQDAIACALGKAKSETQYLLQKFGFEHPKLIHTARCMLSEIEKDDPLLAGPDLTMKEALDLILSRKNKGIFIVDEKERLLGLLSVSDLTKLWAESGKSLKDLISSATLTNIARVLKGKYYCESKHYHPSGIVQIMPSMSDKPDVYKNSIVIVRNNPDIQRFVIDAGAALVVVSGEDWIDAVTLSYAKEKGVPMLHTDYSVIECSRLIYQTPSVKSVMTTDVMTFQETEYVDEVSDHIAKTRYRTYPVLDKEGRVVGAISRYHLFHYEKKKFILVDHNEAMQSVRDLEFGEVVEIIDHHRMGGIETVTPINIVARTVGSTAAIITGLYKSSHIKLPKNLAGILLGAAINDTMCLQSPTTTPFDHEMVKYLEEVSGTKAVDLYQEMLNASDSVTNKTDVELLYNDFKEFRISGTRIAIAQVQCKKDDYFAIKDHFHAFMEETAEAQHYDLVLTLFTDPMGSGSYFLAAGKKSSIVTEAFGDLLNKDHFGKGIVSRKKQVLPIIIDTLK